VLVLSLCLVVSCIGLRIGLGRGSKFFFCDELGGVGLGQSVGGFGWAGSTKMDTRTTLDHHFSVKPGKTHLLGKCHVISHCPGSLGA